MSKLISGYGSPAGAKEGYRGDVYLDWLSGTVWGQPSEFGAQGWSPLGSIMSTSAGAAGGDLAGTYPNPTFGLNRSLNDSTGVTQLRIVDGGLVAGPVNGVTVFTNPASSSPSLMLVSGGSPAAALTGDANTILGYQSGYNMTAGRESVFVGWKAGYTYTTSGAPTENGLNTFIGSTAGMITDGAGTANVFVGQKAGLFNTTGADNVYIGAHSGNSFATGNKNVAVGRGAADNSASFTTGAGGQNVLLGWGTLAGMTGTNNNNTFVGCFAGAAQTATDNNTFVGASAGVVNTTGTRNVAVGTESGGGTTANDNICVGYRAGKNLTSTASQWTIIGNTTSAITAGGGIIIGYTAGGSLTSGSNNCFIGNQAGNACVSAQNNTFVGNGAGRLATGSSGTMLGLGAGGNVAAGASNTLIGQSAGTTITTGGFNTILGTNADVGSSGTSSSIVIGAGTVSTASNQATLGPATITQTVLRGKLTVTGMPTSSAGLSSGDVYSNAGILTIVP